MTAEKTIKFDPAKSVLRLQPGDKIRLSEGDFVRLSNAIFAEIAAKFTTYSSRPCPIRPTGHLST